MVAASREFFDTSVLLGGLVTDNVRHFRELRRRDIDVVTAAAFAETIRHES